MVVGARSLIQVTLYEMVVVVCSDGLAGMKVYGELVMED